jgi:predicted  nucleic acid-binding Zn-ribbon protein
MDFDWLPKLLPLINATGVPLLAVGCYLLFRAYQKSIDTYKETHEHLSEENKRLREQLQSVETGYFDQVNKMKDVVSKTVDAISELQARKVALLSKPDEVPKDAILSDVNRINEAINLMQKLIEVSKEVKFLYRRHLEHIEEEVKMKEYNYRDLAKRISYLSERIGDTSSRVLVVSVISSDKAIEQIKKEAGEQKRGMVMDNDLNKQEPVTPPSNPLMLDAPEEALGDSIGTRHFANLDQAPHSRGQLDDPRTWGLKEEEKMTEAIGGKA